MLQGIPKIWSHIAFIAFSSWGLLRHKQERIHLHASQNHVCNYFHLRALYRLTAYSSVEKIASLCYSVEKISVLMQTCACTMQNAMSQAQLSVLKTEWTEWIKPKYPSWERNEFPSWERNGSSPNIRPENGMNFCPENGISQAQISILVQTFVSAARRTE